MSTIKGMKPKLEKLIACLLIAPLAPLAGGMGAWFLSSLLLSESWILFAIAVGFGVGVMADFFLLHHLLPRYHQLSWIFWFSVLLFYAVGMFGFFMGVPVFHVLLAIPVGFIVGGRMAYEKADAETLRIITRRTCLLLTALLYLTCNASAFFALTSPSTPQDLEGMLHLPFHVTPGMVWGIILIGGVGLLAVNWILTVISTRLTYRFMGPAWKD